MARRNEELEFNEAYTARVKALREAKGWTAEDMAAALGIPADRYRKYEKRSPLPPYLVERFALICDKDVQFVLTGRPSPKSPAASRAALLKRA